MENNDKENLKKQIKDGLDHIEEESKFKKSMGEQKMSIEFASGVENDLAEIMSKTKEEQDEENEKYHEETVNKIKSEIETYGELTIYDRGYNLNDFIDDNNNLNEEALHQVYYNDEKIWGDFKTKILPEFLKGNAGFVWKDIQVCFKDGRDYFITCLKTRTFAKQEWIEEIRTSLFFINQLKGVKTSIDKLFDPEYYEQDQTWREDLWKDQEELLNTIERKYWDEFIKDKEPLDIKDYYLVILKKIQDHHNVIKDDYPSIDIWIEDSNNILENLKELEEFSLDSMYEETPTEILCVPEFYNCIGMKEMAEGIRKWVKEYVGDYSFKIRHPSYEEYQKITEIYSEFLKSRMPDIKEEKKEEKENKILNTGSPEYIKKYGTQDYYGKYL